MLGKKIAAILIVFLSFFLVGCDALFGLISTTAQPTTAEVTTLTDVTTETSSILTNTTTINTNTASTNLTTTNITSNTITTTAHEENLAQKLTFIYNLATEAGEFDGTYEEWLETVRGPQGIPGEDGREIVLQVSGGYIQWKYSGDTTWVNLVELQALTGPAGEDGETVEFRLNEGIIQWKYLSETTWINLFEINDLTGNDGADGREIVLRVDSGYIQWQYSGELTWVNLIELNSLTGESGLKITDISFNELGEMIVSYSDGTEYNLGNIVMLYTVNFIDYNGYLLDTQRVGYSSAVTAPEDPSREGYTFTGWSTDFSNITGNLNVYAEYSINTYSVDFNTGIEGYSITSDLNVPHGATREYPILARVGYRFLGWFIDSSMTPFYSNTPIVKDMTLYAKWEKIVYTANFIGLNDLLLGSYTFTVDDKMYYPEAPNTLRSEGYDYIGWSHEFEYLIDLVNNYEYDYFQETINIYALYSQPLTISFETFGGNYLNDITDVFPGDVVFLPWPQKDFHTFIGWYLNPELTEPFEIPIMPEHNLLLYAKYTKTPVILGVSDLVLSVNSEFDPLEGIYAYDEEDGFLSINISSVYDLSKPGEYIITYRATDSEGVTGIESMILTVTDLIAVYPTGMYNFYYASSDLRNTFMAEAERYLLTNLYGGVPIFGNGYYEIFSDRIDVDPHLPLPVVYNTEEMTYLGKDDSNYEFYRLGLGEPDKYTYRTVIQNDVMPSSFNHWENSNEVYDSFFNLFVENLYEKSYDDVSFKYEVKPALAESMPIAVDPDPEINGVVAAHKWRISLKPDLVWNYHYDFDQSVLPDNHEILDAYDIYYSIKYALDNGWYQAVSGKYNFLGSNIKIKGAEDYLDGYIGWEDVGIKVIDNLTIEFDFSYLLTMENVINALSYVNIAPINVELYDYFNDYGYSVNETAFSGPYSLKEAYSAQELEFPVVTLEKNLNCYNYLSTLFDGYHVTFTINDYNLFTQGFLDHAFLGFEEELNFIGNPNLMYVKNPTTYRLSINGLNTIEQQIGMFPESTYQPEPILANLNFKKAMYHAINKLNLSDDDLSRFYPQYTYYSDAYYVDTLYGIPYRQTDQGMEVTTGLYPDTYGYNPVAAKAYFNLAIIELIENSVYQEGSSLTYNEIVLDLLVMEGSIEIAEKIKNDFESMFVSDEYKIKVVINIVVKPFPSMYYDYVMIGEYDLAITGISGNELEATAFMDVFCDDNRSGYTLDWGIDTSSANIPIYYIDDEGNERFEIWSYNNITQAFWEDLLLVDGISNPLIQEILELDIQTEAFGYEYINLPYEGSQRSSITWTLISGEATLENNLLRVDNPTTDSEIVLEAMISNGFDMEVVTFTIAVKHLELITDFSQFYVKTNGDYDIADQTAVAVKGIVTFYDDNYNLAGLVDEFGNSIVIQPNNYYLSAGDEIITVARIETYIDMRVLIGIENTTHELDYDIPIAINQITLDDFASLTPLDYAERLSYTGFQIYAIEESEVILRVYDGINSYFFRLLTDKYTDAYFYNLGIGDFLPEVQFSMFNVEWAVDEYYMLGFSMPEAETVIDNYNNVILGAYEALQYYSYEYNEVFIEHTENMTVMSNYIESVLFLMSPMDISDPILDNLEVFLEAIYSYNNTVATITFKDIVYVWDPLDNNWYEENGTALLIEALENDFLNNGNIQFIFILNDGSNYSEIVKYTIFIDLDILADYENIFEESYSNLSMYIYNAYHAIYGLNVKVRIYSESVPGDRYDFIHDYLTNFLNNLEIYKGDVDLVKFNFMGIDYTYSTTLNNWVDADGNQFYDVFYTMIVDYWVVQGLPYNTFGFVLYGSTDYKINIIVSVYFNS